MVSEDVRITEDSEHPWSWNVTADYRFLSHADKTITLPILFPSDVTSSSGCEPIVGGFKARVNGKAIDAEKSLDALVSCTDLEGTCPLAKAVSEEHAGEIWPRSSSARSTRAGAGTTTATRSLRR
jgi:hypothetical protein